MAKIVNPGITPDNWVYRTIFVCGGCNAHFRPELGDPGLVISPLLMLRPPVPVAGSTSHTQES
jgi:hypothetical protein